MTERILQGNAKKKIDTNFSKKQFLLSLSIKNPKAVISPKKIQKKSKNPAPRKIFISARFGLITILDHINMPPKKNSAKGEGKVSGDSLRADHEALLERIRKTFRSGKSRSYEWRISQIISLERMLRENGILLADFSPR